MSRITASMLNQKVEYLNSISKVKYELYHRYGHVSLVNAKTEKDITSCGTKSSVYYEIDAITTWLYEEEKEMNNRIQEACKKDKSHIQELSSI